MRPSIEQRARAIGIVQAGADQNVVARQLGVHKSTISRLVLKFRQTNTVGSSTVWTATCNHVTAGSYNTFNALRKPF